MKTASPGICPARGQTSISSQQTVQFRFAMPRARVGLSGGGPSAWLSVIAADTPLEPTPSVPTQLSEERSFGRSGQTARTGAGRLQQARRAREQDLRVLCVSVAGLVWRLPAKPDRATAVHPIQSHPSQSRGLSADSDAPHPISRCPRHSVLSAARWTPALFRGVLRR